MLWFDANVRVSFAQKSGVSFFFLILPDSMLYHVKPPKRGFSSRFPFFSSAYGSFVVSKNVLLLPAVPWLYTHSHFLLHSRDHNKWIIGKKDCTTKQSPWDYLLSDCHPVVQTHPSIHPIQLHLYPPIRTAKRVLHLVLEWVFGLGTSSQNTYSPLVSDDYQEQQTIFIPWLLFW